MPKGETAMIKLEKVSKIFHSGGKEIPAVQDVTLDIQEGEIFGIIGFSGAGKSTLVRCINLLEKPTAGRVTVDGVELTGLNEKKLREVRRKIGMIFQHFNLLRSRTVYQNIAFPLRKSSLSKAEKDEKINSLLELVGLADKKDAYPSQLSGGQKQRVAIARALASEPNILLCDEATSALDPQTTASILALLKEINRKFGITIVIITHQMSVIREICSHVAIIEKGSLVESGTVEEIFAHPKSVAGRELILKDLPEGGTEEIQGEWQGERRQRERLAGDKKLRIVFSENSAFEPVIANMVLKFGAPVNILRADTKNVAGVAKGEMILGLPQEKNLQREMERYLWEKGLEIEEVTGDVE